MAAATDTKLYDNLHMMHRTGWLPYLVSLAAYAALSVTHPLAMVDSGVLDQLSGTFSLSWWTAIPALLILILPLCKVPIRPTMAVSALTALLVTVFAQGRALLPTLRDAVLGYLPAPGSAARRALRRRHDVHGLGHHHGRQHRAVRRGSGAAWAC